MAIKFSQFVLKTLPSELDFIVGYTGTENLQITPDNFLAPYLGLYLPLAGGTMTGDINMDDGAGASPNIKFINGANDEGTIYINASGKLEIATSGIARQTISSGSTEFSGDIIIPPLKALYLDNGGGTYIYESSDGVIDFYGDTTHLVSMKQNGTQSEVVVNEGSGDVDFRCESNAFGHAFFVQASDGYVGIGTATPSDLLTVSNPSNTTRITMSNQALFQSYYDGEASARIQLGRDVATPGGAGVAFGGSGGYSLIGTDNTSGTNLYFKAGSAAIGSVTTSPQMMINGSTGNIGIGNNNPNQSGLGIDHTVVTIGTSTGMGMVELTGTRTVDADLGRLAWLNAATRRAEIVVSRIDENTSTKMAFSTSNAGSLGTRMTIAKDGNVGIGTTAPVSNANWAGLTLSGTTGGQIDFQDDGTTVGSIFNGTWGLAVTSAPTKELRLYSSDTIALTFDTSQDATFAGNVRLPDNGQLNLGAGNDLQLYHDGANSYITNAVGHIYMINSSDDKNIYFQTDDGGGGFTTYFKIDGLSEFVEFDKMTRHMDSVQAQFGSSGDSAIYHDGTNWEFVQMYNEGSITFRNDDGGTGTTPYFEISGTTYKNRAYKDINFNDNVKATFGNVLTPDLEIYHDGSNSYIEDTGTGNFYIRGSERIRFQGINGEPLLYLNENSNVEMYYDNALKIETTSTGTLTTGQMNLAGLNTAPASAAAAGVLGEIRYTADYIYVCTATNTWKRSALSTW